MTTAFGYHTSATRTKVFHEEIPAGQKYSMDTAMRPWPVLSLIVDQAASGHGEHSGPRALPLAEKLCTEAQTELLDRAHAALPFPSHVPDAIFRWVQDERLRIFSTSSSSANSRDVYELAIEKLRRPLWRSQRRRRLRFRPVFWCTLIRIVCRKRRRTGP